MVVFAVKMEIAIQERDCFATKEKGVSSAIVAARYVKCITTLPFYLFWAKVSALSSSSRPLPLRLSKERCGV